ncbi:dihydroxyacetone kinase subunit DhaL [Fundicoccus culcitae]|uniref:Dihydroxyacetone kinase subunit DhaL n=1 Tax=Fundicoccus culcitae TaxID=2969821 RepID=A0ABY5P4U6_9LACT|nr:dihydroxyacetone kinase subunit DhaL [Fundicoccus culcitae]UUX33433.1 dihydroxyacetone kinase subunit DhaL [Fundicoccus culcitae]
MDVSQTIKWMEIFHAKINENKQTLNLLDTPIGDGDHGSNMVRGMNAVWEGLEEGQPGDVPTALKIIAKNLLSKVGGSAGPLYGSAFLGMAKSMQAGGSFPEAIQQAAESIMQRGKSTTGEKTMNDVWVPVAQALQAGTLTDESIDQLVQSTAQMKATKGRASYVGDRSMGHVDPGAYSSGLLFKALIEVEGEK